MRKEIRKAFNTLKFVFGFSQPNLKKSSTNDKTMNTMKAKTKVKESTKFKKTTNNFKETIRSSHVNASNEPVNVEMKDKLVFRPVGRWFEEVIKTTAYICMYLPPSLSFLKRHYFGRAFFQSPVAPSTMNKEQDIDAVYVEKIKKIAESLLENESTIYRKGSSSSQLFPF